MQTDQSTPAENGSLSGYEQSDLLWGKEGRVEFTQEQIVIKYHHILAGVRVHLNKGTGISDTEWQKLEKIVLVDHTKTSSTVDLSTGSVVANGEIAPIHMADQSNDDYRAVVIPQTVAAGKQLLSITLDGQTYSHKLSTDMLYQSGKLHNFTMTVNKSEATGDYEISVTDDGITPWINDESSHQFTANAYVVVHCSEPGKLEESITKAGYDLNTIKNLKVTGILTNSDFIFGKAKALRHLNLSDVTLRTVSEYYEDDGTNAYTDTLINILPNAAFQRNEQIESLILPKKLKGIEDGAFGNMRLKNSTLEIPEGVKYIGNNAFSYNEEYNGVTLVLPYSIDSIGEDAFFRCHYDCELRISDNLKYVGSNAFYGTPNFHGVLHIPSQLRSLNKYAFAGLGVDGFIFFEGETKGQFIGEVEIPLGSTEIPTGFLYYTAFKNRINLRIPDGVKKIGTRAFQKILFNAVSFPNDLVIIEDEAFYNSSMPFSISLPANLISIGKGAFCNGGLEGELKLPESCVILGERCFANNSFTKVSFSSVLEEVPDNAFAYNGELTSVILPPYLNHIGNRAFEGCKALQVITCLAKTPPVLEDNVWDVYWDKCVLQVPEESIDAYKNSDGWNRFQNITAYHELAVNITDISVLNAGGNREGILQSKGPWKVSKCPSWCQVEPLQGNGKTKIKITVSSLKRGEGNREGIIEFCLQGKEYSTYIPVNQFDYQYSEKETIVLQEASSGSPQSIPLFFVGEGYSAKEIVNGTYLKEIKDQVDYLFSCEPYKAYRPRFEISTAIAVSAKSGITSFYGSPINGETSFNTRFVDGNPETDEESIIKFATSHYPNLTTTQANEITIVLLMNTTQGNNKVITDLQNGIGRTITLLRKSADSYPYDQRGQVLHYVGGLAFGKLCEENIVHFTFAKSCKCSGCLCWNCYWSAKQWGWFENITESGKRSDVPWKHLIYHEKYAPYVDVYEGGYRHARGFYRSEENSVMSNYIPYFNTISRESIVKRIMKICGESYSFDKFVEKDKIEIPE